MNYTWSPVLVPSIDSRLGPNLLVAGAQESDSPLSIKCLSAQGLWSLCTLICQLEFSAWAIYLLTRKQTNAKNDGSRDCETTRARFINSNSLFAQKIPFLCVYSPSLFFPFVVSECSTAVAVFVDAYFKSVYSIRQELKFTCAREYMNCSAEYVNTPD